MKIQVPTVMVNGNPDFRPGIRVIEHQGDMGSDYHDLCIFSKNVFSILPQEVFSKGGTLKNMKMLKKNIKM